MSERRVLVVDDDPDTLASVSLHLEAAGFEVETAESAAEAFKRLETAHPAVIVSDVRMPGMSGHELCRLVRGLGHDEIPFIFYSVAGGRLERLAGLRSGADDYIAKPSTPMALVDTVRRHLNVASQIKAFQRRLAGGPRAATLRGELGALSIPQLFELIDFYGLDEVRLQLEASDGTSGQLYVSNQQIVHAAVGGASGEAALVQMLAWQKGAFRVERSACPVAPTMRLPLSECARLMGGSRSPCQAPARGEAQ